MIVLLAYYSDGSATPEVIFIEDGPDKAVRIARAMLEAGLAMKQIQAFKITALDKPAMPIEL